MEFKLIIKKINNTLTKEEEVIFSNWYKKAQTHRDFYTKVEECEINATEFIDVEKAWDELTGKIKSRTTAKKRRSLWKYSAAAAIALLVIVSSGLFVGEVSESNNIVSINKKIESKVKPGTDKAVLTLEDGNQLAIENGRKLELDDLVIEGAQLIYNKARGDKAEEIKYNYLTIPRGGQFYTELADGTKVWMNSESKLKYPVRFIKGQDRVVELIYGEAYFDVSHSTRHNGAHFKVITQAQEIDVLGTEFNVKAYNNEKTIVTTLIDGKISLGNGISKKILLPYQQAKFNVESDDILVSKVDVFDEVAWKRGVFSFKNKPLKEIMSVLSRWYNIDIVIESKEKELIEFTGVLNRNQNILEILLTIKNINDINYDLNDDKIILK